MARSLPVRPISLCTCVRQITTFYFAEAVFLSLALHGSPAHSKGEGNVYDSNVCNDLGNGHNAISLSFMGRIREKRGF